MIKFIMSGSSLTIYGKDETYVVAKDHPNFDTILSKCMEDEATEEDIHSSVYLKKAIEVYKDGEFTVEDDVLKFNGRVLPTHLSDRLVKILREGGNIDPFYNFLTNLSENPSYASVEELYMFLEACSLPITPDGHFLAYKKVTWDYKDLRSRTFNNSVGESPSMKRNEVDDDRRKTCSNGLHVCSYAYLSSYGGTGTSQKDDRVVICKVNPKDVVSVPADYDNQKMRVCSYKVMDEVPNDGMTKIMSWLCGNRKENWIRDTLHTIRALVKSFLGYEDPKFSDELSGLSVTEAQMFSFLEALVKEFKMNTLGLDLPTFLREKILNERISIQRLLQFVSNYATE